MTPDELAAIKSLTELAVPGHCMAEEGAALVAEWLSRTGTRVSQAGRIR